MSTYDSLFKTIEEYKDITVDALTYSKIGKGEHISACGGKFVINY